MPVLMRLLWAAALVLPAFGASAAVVLTTLHSFQQSFPNGANPAGWLVQGSDGNFYGTTEGGGLYNAGTVFAISTNGALTTLYAFGTVTNAYGQPQDGATPEAGLVQGSDGNFYGTTSGGGTNGDWGTVFKISTNGALTSLYSFGSIVGPVSGGQGEFGALDGANPSSWLVQGSDGSFYGTTEWGGSDLISPLPGRAPCSKSTPMGR
jgi:uncharacterized repeat protein (TIGR03803 family)